jgi:hypothetical protein
VETVTVLLQITIYLGMHSNSYARYLKLRDEVLKHKWIESEKAKQDIGFEQALLDWLSKHHGQWKKENCG